MRSATKIAAIYGTALALCIAEFFISSTLIGAIGFLLVFFGAGALAAAAIPAPRRIAHAIVAMELSASATLGLLGLVTWLCALAGWIQGDAFGRPLGRESTLNNTNGYLVMGAVALWLPIVWLFGLGGFTFGRLLTRRRRAVPPVVVVREMRA
jgi:hypothetical protein